MVCKCKQQWIAVLLGCVVLLPTVAQDEPESKPAEKKESERLGPLFKEVTPTLEDAVKLVDQHKDLPKRTLFFGEDQRSNRKKINELLDQAIEVLGVSGLSETRTQIRELEANIREAHEQIAAYKRKRVSAPKKESLGVVQRANPFTYTREDYDEAIEGEEANIDAWETDLGRLRTDFAAKLRSTGLELEEEAVESLLSSVTGDDIVTMAIVFDNVKQVTDQLQILTEESNEALDTAKRYYGMYVVLVEVLNHIQLDFITQVKEQHIPALKEFEKQADRNIDEAKELIRKQAGDEAVLRSNISANETTREAAKYYVQYLNEQVAMVENENKEVVKTLSTAMNTYETVKLSSDLAQLMATGRQAFNTLMRLRLPYLREFKNEAIRREFQRMTTQLQK